MARHLRRQQAISTKRTLNAMIEEPPVDRWLAHALGWTLLIIGGGALYTVMEGTATTGLVLAIGTFAVSMGVTLVHDDIKQHRREHHRGDDRGGRGR